MTRFTLPKALAGLLAFSPLSPLPLRASDVALEGAEAGRWTMDLEAATKLAKDKDLPILLNFTGSDWCGWCKLMDQNVYSMKEWRDYAAASLVLVTIDFPADKTIVPEKYVARNRELQEKFEVGGYPTYVLLDSDGATELRRLQAGEGKTPASFIAEVNGALKLRAPNVEKKVSELGPEKGAAYRDAIAKLKAVESELKAWLETKPPRNPENDAKFAEFRERFEEAREAVDAF